MLFETLILLALIVFVLFLPGWSLLLAIFGRSQILTSLEKFILSFGLSLISVDFIFFAYSRLNLPINRLYSLVGIAFFILVGFLIFIFRKFPEKESSDSPLFLFSSKKIFLILFLIFLIFLVKTSYLSGAIAPTSTDMGHHMYWSKWMVENQQLPTYEGMPDFIIGEHVVFGVMAILGNLDFFGAFPVIILYLFNLLSIFMVFILVIRIFESQKIAILSLLFLGLFLAVSSPQAKFVSGGVIGNTFGNFLLPLVFYLYFRAFEFFGNKDTSSETKQSNVNLKIAASGAFPRRDSYIFLALAVFSTIGLFYTHHLSAFVFLFSFLAIVLVFLVTNLKNAWKITKAVVRMVFDKKVLLTLLISLTFFFFVFTPNYVKKSAVDTAVGSPTKITRVGLTWDNLRSNIGEARLGVGMVGLLCLLLAYRRRNFGWAIVLGWFGAIFVMSVWPQALRIDLPSNRIGNYLSYPLAILAAFGWGYVFSLKNFNKLTSKTALYLLLIFVFGAGLSDAMGIFQNQKDLSQVGQVFDSSEYLKGVVNEKDGVIKDHNYLVADSWIKLFFMRGYKYPLSRGYFKRYEDETTVREDCTLFMISDPGSEKGEKCFSETGTNFVIVNPKFDEPQFRKFSNFDKIYSGQDISIFYKK